jgi:ABC-type spermidine/putrescine transport system permease subunit II
MDGTRYCPAPTHENYLRLFTDPRILEPIRNSLVMGLLTLLAVVLVGVTGGLSHHQKGSSPGSDASGCDPDASVCDSGP